MVMRKLAGYLLTNTTVYMPRICMLPHKADGMENASSDLLINSCRELTIHLSLLFNALMCHRQCPRNMLLSTLVPIQKNGRKLGLLGVHAA